jgi:hypothetical protein
MADADDGDDRGRTRRRAVRNAGALAGVLSMLGASGHAGAAAERRGRVRPVCSGDGSGGPNDWNLDIVSEQLSLRESNEPSLDEGGVRTVLREYNGEFDGALILFAASDFGQPRVFLPEGVSDHGAALQAILDRIHERRWREENPDLRRVHDRAFDEVQGLHQALPALYRGDGAEYDVTAPWEGGPYTFRTITQLVGFVDWMANADGRWLDDHRLTY